MGVFTNRKAMLGGMRLNSYFFFGFIILPLFFGE